MLDATAALNLISTGSSRSLQKKKNAQVIVVVVGDAVKGREG